MMTEGFKKCLNVDCGRGLLPLSDFGNNKHYTDAYESYCKLCINKMNREKYHKNHARYRQLGNEAYKNKPKKKINDCSDAELAQIEARFWGKVLIKSPNECWEYQGYRNPTGYANFTFKGSLFKAHRLAYKLANSYLDDNLLVCHTCDNRMCVNPAHLYLGTHKDNSADMYQRGRASVLKGEDVSNSKLNVSQVLEIRKLYSLGESRLDLAKKYNVGRTNIDSIVTNKTWKDVDNA